MTHETFISVIIPLYVIGDRFFRDLRKFDDINYKNFEIIVVCDRKINLPKLRSKVKILLTHKRSSGPAEKRDLAIKKARGEVCAFIDDDAYPDVDWLRYAIKEFKNPKIAAVGGPGLTPPEDGFKEQITGMIYSSFFCGGLAQYRFVKKRRRYVVDYPAYNLLVRTSVLKKIGGYGNYFYGGEDTFLCLKMHKLGYKMIYNPNVVVYHHRRPIFLSYLKQIANVGKHRGFFAKKFPETSLYFWYFVPASLTVLFILLLVGSFFNFYVRSIFLALLFFSFLVAWLSVIKKGNPIMTVLAAIGIIATHLTYGQAFIKGILIKDLKR